MVAVFLRRSDDNPDTRDSKRSQRGLRGMGAPMRWSRAKRRVIGNAGPEKIQLARLV
jgi:hypothetical protein